MNQAQLNQNLQNKTIHFIGIGGIGMSALARYCFAIGSHISGSDKESSSLLEELKTEGIKNIWVPHNAMNIEKINPDIVAYTTAITNSNEELIWAKENKKQILHRSDLLALAINQKKLIGVSGTHGKTTVTAMVSEILINSGLDPTVVLGGILLSKQTNAILGNGEYFVIEADESDKSHLKGNPEIAVITNIEVDHLENYNDSFEELKNSFVEFAKRGLYNKGLIACIDDKVTSELISKYFKSDDSKLITYGLKNKAKLTSIYNQKTNLWDIYFAGNQLTSIKLQKPGIHNILNALAAFGVGYLLGINPENIKLSLESYEGVKRRFHILLKTNELTIIDDYAHHPTEIIVTIQSAKELKPKRLIVILQPHQPKRLKDLWQEFINALKIQEDLIFVTDTYLARGSEIEGISSKKLVEEVNKPNISYLPGNIPEIAKYIEKIIKCEDLIITMGAGSITSLGPLLIKSYERLASKVGNN